MTTDLGKDFQRTPEPKGGAVEQVCIGQGNEIAASGMSTIRVGAIHLRHSWKAGNNRASYVQSAYSQPIT